ncbi:MAG: hypothetical protein ACJ8J0_03175 [Longimicrobiaceae bacterium]
MTYRALALILPALAAAAPVAAQRRPAPLAAARLETSAPAALAPELAPAAVRAGRGTSARNTAVNVVAGALIGAGAGYLASQVAWSDWDKASNSEFRGRRLNFTLGGSALGAVGGLLLGRGAGGGGVRGAAPARLATASDLITEEEVRASTAENVFQLVQALRPFWLRREGANGHTRPSTDPEAPPATISAADDPGVRVYVERGFVGDIWTLRQMTVKEVTSLEFLDTAAATYRLGMGNPSGAIIVHTGQRRQ